jgi:Ca2+-binding RTX toxin-like protein
VAVSGLAVGATVFGGASAADAATFTVTNLNDTGSGSLRDAIDQANTNQDPDQIVFQSGLSGQITLASLLFVHSPVDIAGPGVDQITVSGNDTTRIFTVYVPAGGDASISGLTLTHGSASAGGGIAHEGGDLTISASVISESSAVYGAGIFFDGQNNGSLTVVHSTISGNTASMDGGGLRAEVYEYDDQSADASVSVRYSTISGNHAQGGSGGGIDADAEANGTGCPEPIDPLCEPAFASANVTVAVEHSTVAGNITGGSGGGIFAREAHNSYGNASAEVDLRNTIVADDTAGGLANDTDTVGGDSHIQGDFSLVEADFAPVNPINETSMIKGQDPQLGPLQDNGGPTPTMALPKTSPAVDKGNKYQATTDQRGLPREADWIDVPNSTARPWDGTDMGAFELQIPPPPPIPAECNSTETTRQGTGGNDVITGTPQRDVIQGLGGNDTIRGLGGNDLLCGGAGKDKLVGGAGNDIVFGEAGGDKLQGGQGKDFLLGGGGADTLLGGGGKDSLLGGGGKDKLNGGPGKDLEKQ